MVQNRLSRGLALSWIVAVVFVCAEAVALENGLARTPPMGWMSWCPFIDSPTEKGVMETVDSMVSYGLRDAGYEYVQLDDGWMSRTRDSLGGQQPDPVKFPRGIKFLADYVHSKGMKMGIYSCNGKTTCEGYPASFGREEADARHYAEWGIDYLKYDCGGDKEGIPDQVLYCKMREAIKKTGRPILYNICIYYSGDTHLWGDTVGNTWRTGGDIVTDLKETRAVTWKNWFDVLNGQLIGKESYAGPGHWNDPDNVIVAFPRNNQQTIAEQRSQFSIWAIEAAPLFLACDVRTINAEHKAILLNKEVIAVDQDSLGKAGRRIRIDQTGGNKVHVFVKEMRDGGRAVVLFNENLTTGSVTVTRSDLGLMPGVTVSVRDLWNHQDRGTFGESIQSTIAPHDVVMLRFVPGPDRTPPQLVGASALGDSGRVNVAFNEAVEKSSAENSGNYVISGGVTILGAALSTDLSTVVLRTSPISKGVTYTLTVNNIRDRAATPNVIKANSQATFNVADGITSIRYFPRTGWADRMTGGVFEGTTGDKTNGPYQVMHTIPSTPVSGQWTEVTSLQNAGEAYRYVRYRSPDNGWGNVAEIQFYAGTTRMSGPLFGTPGSFDNLGNDFTKVFDGDTTTFMDCAQGNGGYAGLDLIGGSVSVHSAATAGARRGGVPSVRKMLSTRHGVLIVKNQGGAVEGEAKKVRFNLRGRVVGR